MTYRRRDTALHAARASLGALYCLALGALALSTEHPLVLAGALAAVVGAWLCAGLARELPRALLLALPFALLIAVINPLVNREGLTVIFRGPELPWGPLDITLEATVYGGVLGLRALVLMLSFGLYALAVDPDEVLRLFRRVSFRSALTAAIANRMVPVLARDARRFADAQRCRPEGGVARLAVVRAVTTGALDRAADVAATLEVRGYGAHRPAPRGAPRPWSRHDLAFAAASVVLLALAFAIPVAGLAPFDAYPALEVPVDAGIVLLALVVPLVALLPFADRRGVAA